MVGRYRGGGGVEERIHWWICAGSEAKARKLIPYQNLLLS